MRIKWDKEETLILVDYYSRVQKNELARKEAVNYCSEELRYKALLKGIAIDEIYRNQPGISMQLSKIEDLCSSGPRRLSSPPPAVFEDVVTLYKEDKESFKSQVDQVRYDIFGNSNPIDHQNLSEIDQAITRGPVPFQSREQYDSPSYLAQLQNLDSAITLDRETQHSHSTPIHPERSRNNPIGSTNHNINEPKNHTQKSHSEDDSKNKSNKTSYTRKRLETNAIPRKLVYFGESYTLNGWNDLYYRVLSLLSEDYPDTLAFLWNIGFSDLNPTQFGYSYTSAVANELTSWNVDWIRHNLSLSKTPLQILYSIRFLLESVNIDQENLIIYFSADRDYQDIGPRIPQSKIPTACQLLDIVYFYDANRNIFWLYDSGKLKKASTKWNQQESVNILPVTDRKLSPDGDLRWSYFRPIKNSAYTLEEEFFLKDWKSRLSLNHQTWNTITCKYHLWAIDFHLTILTLINKESPGLLELVKDKYKTLNIDIRTDIGACMKMLQRTISKRPMSSQYKNSIGLFLLLLSCDPNFSTESLSPRLAASQLDTGTSSHVPKEPETHKVSINNSSVNMDPTISDSSDSMLPDPISPEPIVKNGDSTTSEPDNCCCESSEKSKEEPINLQQNAAISPKSDEMISDEVISDIFPNGMQFKSIIHLKKFANAFNDRTGRNLNPKNPDDKEQLLNIITNGKIILGKFVYSPSALLSQSGKKILDCYLEKELKKSEVLYFRKIYDDLEHEVFMHERIISLEMLREYFLMFYKEMFCIEADYISQEATNFNLEKEVHNLLLQEGSQMLVQDIIAALPNYPESDIEEVLKTSSWAIFNKRTEVFDISLIDLSEWELKKIRDYLHSHLSNVGLLNGDDLQSNIKQMIPDIFIRAPFLSKIGLRNTLIYYFGNDFHFSGDRVSL